MEYLERIRQGVLDEKHPLFILRLPLRKTSFTWSICCNLCVRISLPYCETNRLCVQADSPKIVTPRLQPLNSGKITMKF